MRERWPKARRSSGANHLALRSDSGVFLGDVMRAGAMSCELTQWCGRPDSPGVELLLQLRDLRFRERPRGRRTRRAAIQPKQLQCGLDDGHVGAVLLLGPQVLEARHHVDELPRL